ncbi:amidoligase family protein [Ruminococcus albus]|uniref:Putative amidoligase enzyme n=1 Tax=Ruminococcus albus TaxID=1264 RepID=A0A1I1M273_RUMAL|nr:amidoligase family protein [Ruminococcus albus]SFC79474.1 Putative amidoligase enzyme [Ruminococcus albus]
MPGNFDGIKNRKFGIEIEMTGITRCEASKAIKKVLGGDIDHVGGTYDKYTVGDDKGRKWQIVFDSSIYARKKNGDLASDYYKVELNSPVLEYEDFDLLQSVIRALRKAGAITGPDYDCGTHIHIDASDYTPQQIRNLVNLWSSKEDFLWDALQVSSARSNYCKKINRTFVDQINRKKPKTLDEISDLWYAETSNSRYNHYNPTRYHALNLHSLFQHGHYEIRACNASLHAGEVKAQVLLALAISNAAVTKKYCSPAVSHSDNMRYSFRVFLLNLGFIGDEFKNYRAHLLKHLSGNIAWRHPEDAIAQRERLKAEREAARNELVRPVSQYTDEFGVTHDEEQTAPVDDLSGSFGEDESAVTMNM